MSRSTIPKKSRDIVKKRSGGVCEMKFSGCNYSATDVHHLYNGKDRASHMEPWELVHCDRFCHDMTTRHATGTDAFRWRTTDTPDERDWKVARVLMTRGTSDKDEIIGEKA